MAIQSGVIVGWVSTNASIPAGWTRETSLDGRYVRMIATSATNPGGTGGAASHVHSFGTHAHPISHNHATWPASGAPSATTTSFPNAGGAAAQTSHTHAMSSTAFSGNSGNGPGGNWTSTNAEAAQLTVIFIKSNGTPPGFPANCVAYFNAAAPTGWTQYATGDNRLLKGAAAAGDGGGTADTSVHTHTAAHVHSLPAHSHVLALTVPSGRVAIAGCGGAHTHTAGSSTSTGATCSASTTPGSGNGDVTPPWTKVLLIQNTSGGNSTPLNIIAIWTGTIATIPLGWKLCDGSSGTPNLSNASYVRSSDTTGNIGTTGGAATHTHPGAGHIHTSGGATHTHTASCANSGPHSAYTNAPGCACGGGCGIAVHTHPLTATASCAVTHGCLACTATGASGTGANDPAYTAVAYIQMQAFPTGGLWGYF